MQNKTARHWLPAIPRNIKLTELAAYVIILFEFMRTFFHGFYWQEGIRWRLPSSPLMLYKSVGGDVMSDFEMISLFCMIISLVLVAIELGRHLGSKSRSKAAIHFAHGWRLSIPFGFHKRGRSSTTSVIPFCLYYTMLNRSCQRAYFIQCNLKKSDGCLFWTDRNILPA